MKTTVANINGAFKNREELHMEIPKGFEIKYGKTMVLRLRRTIYGLKQDTRIFWKLLLMAIRSMKCKKSRVDPCLYFKITDNSVLLWLS